MHTPPSNRLKNLNSRANPSWELYFNNLPWHSTGMPYERAHFKLAEFAHADARFDLQVPTSRKTNWCVARMSGCSPGSLLRFVLDPLGGVEIESVPSGPGLRARKCADTCFGRDAIAAGLVEAAKL
ncbi:hypothetical protein [Bradyrhizobium sp. C9]|uniref:hypothetical protein n=1 Tax=Bradyrhizobium sp. C9 TaxID=142585 RepID=UPI001177E6EF|nr:hypothetical protein [Bradyrhizobium sp. C9]